MKVDEELGSTDLRLQSNLITECMSNEVCAIRSLEGQWLDEN